MEMVKKTLGQHDEEKTPKESRALLENIDEETISVNFIRKQFSNFSLGKEETPAMEECSPTKPSQGSFAEKLAARAHAGTDEQELPAGGSISS